MKNSISTKALYITLMEKAVDAYSLENILTYYQKLRREGIHEQGFQRIVSNYGILIAHGKGALLRERFPELFSFCLKEIKSSKEANDFAVKEMAFAVRELEQAGMYPEQISAWRGYLEDMDPFKHYTEVAASAQTQSNNWAAYNVAGECIKKSMGLKVSEEYIERQITSQLRNFDESGFYHDPGCPMLYELAARCQLAVVIKSGYNGVYRRQLEALIRRPALQTLRMQSVTGEIPFGGRSNQFLFNEAYLAAIMEFEAAASAKENPQMAKACKRSARLAADSILRWLNETGGEKHVKNHYPKTSSYGCEDYAFFDKYMASLASFIYLAYYFADDSIPEAACPAEIGGFTCAPPPQFHKFFANAGGYFLEFDTDADPIYDATGLGRIHKKGAPSELMLSVPCPAAPHYTVDIHSPAALALISGGETAGTVFDGENRQEYRVSSVSETQNCVTVKAESAYENKTVLTEQYVIQEDGIHITVSGAEKLTYQLPVFAFDGSTQTAIEHNHGYVSTAYRGWRCTCRTDGDILDTGTLCANRNGHYRRYLACGKKELHISIVIEKCRRNSYE